MSNSEFFNQLAGQALGRYQLDRLLGVGGMGAVYKARDETLKRDVAIKVMNPQLAHQGNFKERFLQEARTVARLNHPNIVQIFDFGQQESAEGVLLYIVMEFISGGNLTQKLREYQATGSAGVARRSLIPLVDVVELMRQVITAVDYAHRQGVLHRDLKPDNIILRPESIDALARSAGAAGRSAQGLSLPYRPVITDLGLSKLSGGDVQTLAGTTMGTPAYISPEQAMGKTVEAATDIYSLGVILFELCTGQLPFEVANLVEAAKVYSRQTPPAPRSINPELPQALEDVILKALQKEPTQRFQNAAAMALALKEALPLPPELGLPQGQRGIPASSSRDTPLAVNVKPARPPQAALKVGSGTKLQNPDAVDLRGPSVMQDFNAPRPSGQDQIQVLYQGKTIQSLSVKPGSITVGREAGNDLVISDPQASRHHIRIEYDGRAYKIVDLNSRNGTFLEDAKLLPGIPEAWHPEKAVRIGATYIRIVPAVAEQSTSIMPAAKSTARDAGQRPAQPEQPATPVSVILDQPEITVEPGRAATAAVTLLNQGTLVDHFSVTVQGIPQKWIPTPIPVVQLMPGAQQVVSFMISPPRESTSRAGTYPLTIRISSRDTPGRPVDVGASLTITPYSQFHSELYPQKIRAGRAARLKIQNQGNAADTFNLLWLDRAVELEFKPPQSSVHVPEGKEVLVEFRGKPRQRPFFGKSRTHNFNAEVRASKGEPQIHNGELVSPPVISWLFVFVLLLLCLCLAAAAVVGYAPTYFAVQTQRAIDATATAMADTDGDTIRDYEETSFGTDPKKADTDADGLKDGEEVKVHGTDPTNKDTDGDTLQDGKEIEIGTSPINPDTDGDGVPDNSDASPILLPTVTPTATSTPKPTQPPWEACPDYYLSRMHIGVNARIALNPPKSQRVRDEASTESKIIGYMEPGEEFEVLGGPECVNDWVWWRVRSMETGLKGWTAEGDGDTYWLEPLP